MYLNHDAIDQQIDALMQSMIIHSVTVTDAVASRTIEQLRRLEDLARNKGDSRQAIQKIMSARRILGDYEDFGPVASFAADDDIYRIRPAPE